jgi:hyaluronan synthase/N-acetylglucosaminyltransferase
MDGILERIVGAYGLLSLSHLFIQMNISHANYLLSRKLVYDSSFHPSVAIIIPAYNEETKALSDCVHSCLFQKYGGSFKVIVVNDGSKDSTGFRSVQAAYLNHPRALFIDNAENKGKRHAQKHGFDVTAADTELVVTIDSDTILEPEAVSFLIQRFKNKKVGAVTGDVRVITTKQFLTNLISARYWSAFNQERAAQSLFGTVLCCSGPLSAYRNSVIQTVKKRYLEQHFLGAPCTYGDDRHLTNLVLEQGYRVEFEPRSRGWTHVPQTITQYIKQQIRWNKSYYRELLWTMKMVVRQPRKFSLYILYDLFIMTFLPILLIISLLFAIYKGIFFGPLYFLGYLAVMASIGLVRAMYGFYRTGDRNLLTLPVYAFIHIFVLTWVRVYAILTLKNTRWGTR